MTIGKDAEKFYIYCLHIGALMQGVNCEGDRTGNEAAALFSALFFLFVVTSPAMPVRVRSSQPEEAMHTWAGARLLRSQPDSYDHSRVWLKAMHYVLQL
ncbi:hypothetical protein N7457_002331 [Penicillium paradoxum]|uniref:uncharacterized protein n=1 Tax=Penicillium paradoxum TaxID=176176 RepID=UPI002547EBE2|nr:uncharacterized protein N7457_002331 [Penicillium paradoxum]KAJ5787341.1 hypothetical protein N7457_002331 [Penicillium paradoxum]